ncbi:MAG: hypothetical protein IE878_05995 [Epsilonproteobacteria bacterium]|nr:hypothetical protein [Campylobacterota bacterium]MBD3839917.1 hypothetical protein [Campylobacterota bacterium]
MNRVINALLIVDIGVVIFCFLSGERLWLINSQIAFVSSSLVLFASLVSYKKMVEQRVALGDDGVSGDVIESMDEKYDFDDDKDKNPEELLKEVKAEMQNDKRGVLEILKDSKTSLSLYRLLAYGVLILGFLYLNNNHLLHISSYLSSLAIPIIVFVIILLRKK